MQERHFAVLAASPDKNGRVWDRALFAKAKAQGALSLAYCDLLALCLFKEPAKTDVAVGSAQRFGVPLGYGGPYAGFFATKMSYKRKIPGRVVGLSKGR